MATPDVPGSENCDTLLNAVFPLDAFYSSDQSPESESPFFMAQRAVSSIQGIIERALVNNDMPLIGLCLISLRDIFDQYGVVMGGIRITEKIYKKLKNQQKEINKQHIHFTLARANRLVESIESHMKHLARERRLETAIWLARCLFDNDKKWKCPETIDCDNAARALIARCYLMRSRLTLPKGDRLPPKKLEALKKAKEWAESIKDGNIQLHLIVRIGMEAERYHDVKEIFPQEIIANLLNSAIKEYVSSDKIDPEDEFFWELMLYAIRTNRESLSSTYKFSLTNIDLKQVRLRTSRARLHLLKALIADADHNTGTFQREMKKAIAVMPLIHPANFMWDEIVDILIKTKQPDRADLAIILWEACEDAERRLNMPFAIHWYWARLQDLYEMSFLDAIDSGDLEKALHIADSVKSKPLLKMSDVTEGMEEVIDAWADNQAGYFIENVPDTASSAPSSAPQAMLPVPDGWAAAHFFVTRKGNDGYAIIKSKAGIELKKFNAGKIWTSFCQWYKTYETLDHMDINVNKRLGDLADILGSEMSFIFDVETNNLLLIPHGFLHLVPVHAAHLDGNYLFAKKSILYLPAYRFARSTDQLCKEYEECKAFVYFNKDDIPNAYVSDFSDQLREDDMRFTVYDDVNRELLFSKLTEISNRGACLIALMCHGLGNRTNPFLSYLALNDGALTLQELFKQLKLISLIGSTVVLGACESDLTPLGANLTDEHLSLAGAFLEKATFVCGNLWEVHPARQKNVLTQIADGAKPYEAIRKLQINWTNRKQSLYDVAPFRVFGFPG